MNTNIEQRFITDLPQIPFRNGVGAYEGVVAHSTANNGDSDEMEYSYFVNNWKTRSAFVQFFSDHIKTLQTASTDYEGWGAGQTANKRYVHCELCETSDPALFKLGYENWIWILAKVLYQRKLGVIDGVTLWSHKECSDTWKETDHQDPIAYLARHGKTWANVVNDVTYLYNCMVAWETPVVPKTQPTANPTYTPIMGKTRVYAQYGKLVVCNGDYKTPATDIHWVVFEAGKFKMDFAAEQGAKVSGLVPKYGADWGFNFPFFWQGLPLGDTEDHDVIFSSAYGNMLTWHDFAFSDGKPVIGKLNVTDHQDFLVQGTPMLIEDGNLVYAYYSWKEKTAPDIANDRAQRTFVGITEVGDLIVASADGRTGSDQGLTLEEMALFMQSMKAVNALNGDGGSSTILFSKKLGAINQQENTGCNERAVNHAVLIYLT